MMADSWRDRAEAVLAAGPATFSKHWRRFPANAPEALVSGEGCYVTGSDGRTYIDCIAALGPNLLGYSNCAVNAAVHRQVDRGVAFSLLHPLEVEVAEMLVAMIPCAEQVRFCLNGSDATNAAIRLARAHTGKEHVYYIGYHGFHDNYVCTTSMAAGVLPVLHDFNHQYRWEDLEGWLLETMITNHSGYGIAAVILEVPPRPWGEDAVEVRDTLQEVQRWCAKEGVLFILDEIVTGFRYGLGGAAAHYSVQPDLVCLGKALANGYPLAALAGPRHIMQDIERRGVFISSTHGGNALGLAAAKATLEELQCTTALTTLHTAGRAIGSSLHALFQQYQLPVTLLGNEARMVLQWQDGPQAKALRTLWMQEMLVRGVLVGGPYFPQSCMHQEVVLAVHRAAAETCAVLAFALKQGDVAQLLCDDPIETDVFSTRYR